jgi:hypothetical protein
MPLIRSAITWSTDKVSASLKNHQESHVENLLPQDLDDTTSEHSLSPQGENDLAVGQRNDFPDSVQLNENLNIEHQPIYPDDEFHPKWTPPPPPSSNPTQTPEPKQITSNEITHPDTIHHSQSPTLLQPTPTYPPPRKSTTIPPQYTDPAIEDRNRADYYQAKYYESQRLQGQYQGQSAQYSDGCGMVSNEQQQSDGTRRGGGGGRGRGRRGRGGGGLIGMLLKH